MSLFKAREFWSIQIDSEETYDRNNLRISQLNSDSDFIITGSQSGLVQIFKPSTEITEENTLVGYKASDLCLEICLNNPILKIEIGKLVSGSPLSQIAILHPLTIAIYSYSSKDGNVDHGQQNMLNILYEHKLRRYSANFVIGPFGGSKQREFICVQSLDGMLTFYEQETFAFECLLPNFLIPGPITYCSKSDSFITFSSNWNIESYSYKKLSEIGETKDKSSAPKFEPDWLYNISEEILQINCLSLNNDTNDCCVLILGDRNVHCINELGHLKFMKKLGYSANCMTNYILDNKIFSLIISETNTLLIYENTTLKWSAQLSFLPVAVQRTNLKNIKCALCLLSEDGKLQCAYLGTEPFLFSAPPLANQQIDFEKTEEELSKLYKIIANSQNKDNDFVNTTIERELLVTVHIDPHLEKLEEDPENGFTKCKVTIEIVPQAIFEEVNIVVSVQYPLIASPNAELFTNITDKVQFCTEVYQDKECSCDIATLNMTVVATVISSAGVPRVVQKHALLPLNLVVDACAPRKESEHKITLNINDNPVAISTLFPEFIGENAITISSNAIGFVNSFGSTVTLLSAKSSQRYRLQSDSVCSLNMVVQEVIRRLMKHYTSQKNFCVTFSASLPVVQVLEKVREHFEAQMAVKKYESELAQLAAQFRLIQKRLISKYKDKNPTPLNNLDMLLQDTYQENCDVVSNLQEANNKLKQSQINLSCILHLVQTLLNITDKPQAKKQSDTDNTTSTNGNKLSPTDSSAVKLTDVTMVTSALCCHIYDMNEQSWEDVTDAGLCYLLRTTLAKSEKDKLRAPHGSFEEVRDLIKLEKHIGQCLERVMLGGSSIIREDDESKQRKEDDSAAASSQIETAPSIVKQLLPLGSTFAEKSTRALSARKSLLRRRQKIQEEE